MKRKLSDLARSSSQSIFVGENNGKGNREE